MGYFKESSQFKTKNLLERSANGESQQEMIDIDNIEEAKEFIKNSIEKGFKPKISVPEKYIDAVKNGIRPHSTWIGENIIAGTIMIRPYYPKGEVRHIFEIEIPPDYIEPRFTGADHHFHGIVVFKGPIPPQSLKELSL